MNAEDYAKWYLGLPVMLFDGTIKQVAIKKYLNTGDAWTNPDAAAARPKAAVAEYSRLLGALRTALGRKPSATFDLDGWQFDRKGLQRAYSGKGSPAEIMDVLWLASRCRFLDINNVQDYCDHFLGLDCNGFVGNFIGQHMPVGAFYQRPRRDFQLIAAGDLIIFFIGQPNSNGKHIAAFGNLTGTFGKQLIANVVDSGGPEVGVKIVSHTLELKKDHIGRVYFDHGKRVGFICEGPVKTGPNSLTRFRAPGLSGELLKSVRDFRADSLLPTAAL